MKKLSTFILLVATICILTPTVKISDDSDFVLQESIVEEFDDNIEEKTIEIVKNNKKKIEKEGKKDLDFIFFGDSRIVGMQSVINSDDIFVAEAGQGYSYFMENLNNVLNKYTDDSIIIIEFGVNDLYNVDLYIDVVNDIAKKGYNICYLTIYPINENISMQIGYTITNNQIDNFNNKLKNNLDKNVKIIDTNKFLKENGFNTNDGLHYDDETYLMIYNYVKNNLNRGNYE